MAHSIIGIDHVLLAVRDLAGAAQVFERLGFVASPRGGHAEWGTANQCLMFGCDYIELIGPVGEGLAARRISRFIETQGEGLMGAGLTTTDAEAASQSLRRAGIAAEPPSALSRQLEAPEGVLIPRFSVVTMPEGTTPGLASFLCQHLTPDLLRRPDWLAHPNGATGIVSLTVVLDQPLAAMPAYDRLFGAAACTPTDDMVTVHTGHGLIYLVTPDGFDHLHPDIDIDPPEAPRLAAVTIAVADLDRAAEVLKANGVRSRRKSDHIAIAPEASLGVGIEFVAG
jgi:hypothetical protein